MYVVQVWNVLGSPPETSTVYAQFLIASGDFNHELAMIKSRYSKTNLWKIVYYEVASVVMP